MNGLLCGVKPRLNSDPNHAGPIQEGTEMDWEYFCKCLFTIKRQREDNVNMQEGIFTMSKNTYSDLLTRRAHMQTHTQNEKKPRVFIGPSQPWTETSWVSGFSGVPDRQRKVVLRNVASDKGRWSSPQSHVGTRGSWRSSCGEQSGSTEGGQGHSFLP